MLQDTVDPQEAAADMERKVDTEAMELSKDGESSPAVGDNKPEEAGEAPAAVVAAGAASNPEDGQVSPEPASSSGRTLKAAADTSPILIVEFFVYVLWFTTEYLICSCYFVRLVPVLSIPTSPTRRFLLKLMYSWNKLFRCSSNITTL